SRRTFLQDMTVDELVDEFGVTREQVLAVLEFAAQSAEAPTLPNAGCPTSPGFGDVGNHPRLALHRPPHPRRRRNVRQLRASARNRSPLTRSHTAL
ncbi:MAG TPA: hypothetical protein VMU71_02695, partial [Terracidiphilus sp.]|nr:hypothetical protein [Terracidiphilus sp.]